MNYPSFEEERKFLQDTYKEARLDPSHVTYIEANSSCSKIADASEINAITDVLCRNKTKPLLIGSVKSNIGHIIPWSTCFI
jgi:acyl transferase domain-containing protein